MDLERIERALREGPADEPAYVPGAFYRRRSTMLMAAAVGAALVIGIVVGLGLDMLRSPNDDTGVPGPDLEVLNAELEGMWKSDVVYRDRFIDFMVERGHAEADIEAFLDRGGVGRQTAFHLFFDGSGRSMVYETTQVTDLLSDEPYELLPDGRLMWGDLNCVVTARFTIAGDRLTFEEVSSAGCDADERIAADAFFSFRPYTFDPGSPY
jgi:hypothetical protein